MEEAKFKSKLAIVGDSVTVASFGVRLPIVEGDGDYARSWPSCAWSAVDPLHSESEMKIARLHRGP